MDLSSRLLRQCVAIAEAGSMSGAATQLGLSPSTLSRALARFEEQTHVTVFERHGSRLVPTDAGRQFLRAAQRVVDDLDVFTAAAADAALGRAGSVVVATPADDSGPVLPTMIAAVTRGRPRLNVHIARAETATAAMKSIRSGAAELALIPRLPTPSDLLGIHVGRQELTLIVPAAWTQSNVRISDRHGLDWLGEFPFIAGAVETTSAHALERLRRSGACPHTVLTGTPVLTIPSLVDAGVGAALVPSSIPLDTFAHIRSIDLTPPLTYPITLMHRTGEQSPATRQFIDWARSATEE
ncbi:LysR family transcriptional regulator [Rhodococcoides fascians]|uniref:LysR family transcriptional regulator n=1 Tax=Rhodococcoides fascians TaxID=1828 RepID=UPI0024BB86A2|nr:LysR family transcriptional regulator [Rhodococcus fascians]MDJ0409324.1 LysR family transcriptional regulator [Rhodococcus fascians]